MLAFERCTAPARHAMATKQTIKTTFGAMEADISSRNSSGASVRAMVAFLQEACSPAPSRATSPAPSRASSGGVTLQDFLMSLRSNPSSRVASRAASPMSSPRPQRKAPPTIGSSLGRAGIETALLSIPAFACIGPMTPTTPPTGSAQFKKVALGLARAPVAERTLPDMPFGPVPAAAAGDFAAALERILDGLATDGPAGPTPAESAESQWGSGGDGAPGFGGKRPVGGEGSEAQAGAAITVESIDGLLDDDEGTWHGRPAHMGHSLMDYTVGALLLDIGIDIKTDPTDSSMETEPSHELGHELGHGATQGVYRDACAGPAAAELARRIEARTKKARFQRSGDVSSRIAYVCKWQTGNTSAGCGRSFSRPSHLQMHLYSHTGERPFSCDTCHKGFGTSWAVTKHRRIHTAEKPFSCAGCSKRFTQRSSWRRHNIKFHGAVKNAYSKAENR